MHIQILGYSNNPLTKPCRNQSSGFEYCNYAAACFALASQLKWDNQVYPPTPTRNEKEECITTSMVSSWQDHPPPPSQQEKNNKNAALPLRWVLGRTPLPPPSQQEKKNKSAALPLWWVLGRSPVWWRCTWSERPAAAAGRVGAPWLWWTAGGEQRSGRPSPTPVWSTAV